MSVVQTEENTLGIAIIPNINLYADSASKLLNFMIVTFNVLKLFLVCASTNSCTRIEPIATAEVNCNFKFSGPHQTMHPTAAL